MKFIATCILIFLTLICYSQCLDKYLVAANVSTAEYELFCYHCNVTKYFTKDSIPDSINAKVKDYIICRTDSAFYKKIELKNMVVAKQVLPESFDRSDEDAMKFCERIKYLYHYTCVFPQVGIIYTFNIEVDSAGNILSKNAIPDKICNPDFDKIISFCEVEKTIKSNKLLKKKPIKKGVFDFNNEANAFVWKIYLDVFEKEKGVYFQNYLLIHANTGEIIKTDDAFYDMPF